MFTDYGYLTIRTYTANGALPIANANIEIRSNERGNDISIFTITDNDGVSNKIKLPTPTLSYSLSPNPKERPYSTYDIKISKEGYYTKNVLNAAIFSGVSADLPVNMISYREGALSPIDNIDSTITENETLEA